MTAASTDIAIFGFAAATLIHAVFALLLLRDPQFGGRNRLASRAFVGAVLVSVGWSLASLVDQFSTDVATRMLAMGLDWLRYGLWLLFLTALVRPALALSIRRPSTTTASLGPLGLAVLTCWVVGAVLIIGMSLSLTDDRAVDRLMGYLLLVALGLPVLGLVLVEQLFRNLPEDSRWNAKPVCLGLAAIFVFDIYRYSESVLFGRFDADASHVRGVVHALALPLIFVASRRRADWIGRLQVSRKAAFYSASLSLVGAYLLFVAGLGYTVRALGGDWGRAMQLALLCSAVLVGLILLLSGTMRARLRVFVGKHFFSYRYDYREQWLRFTTQLSSPTATHDVGGLVVRGLADMMESPAGSLWTRTADSAAYVQAARWNTPDNKQTVPAHDGLVPYLRASGWIIALDEYRSTPQRYGGLSLPPWLLQEPHHWLVVPLSVHDQLLGFVVLARPRAVVQLNWETRDLIKTASRQAAGFLAQMQATEALLELRKFEAFNRMSAFVVHDLKNIVTQLSLMLKNAERLHANPEFQQDMLLTVQSSLEKMKRLMLQLREGAPPPGSAAGVELQPMVQRLQAMARARGRELQVRHVARLATRGHEERLERVLGHLVHNALDATAQGGEVWIGVQRQVGQVKVEVGDSGVGMSDEFVQNRLFRPFNSTKESGMGIGTHESMQYIRELGGQLNVDTEPGRGTLMTVLLPLFDSHADPEPARESV